VAGAAVGNGLVEDVGVADGLAVALGVADGLAVALGVADRLAVALGVADGLALGVLTVTLGLGEMLGDAEVVTPGDSFGNVTCGESVQATTEAEATMAAKPTAVSLA
jgi:hypothetical protein